MIVKDVTQLIGNTPMVEISRFTEKMGCNARILVKPEYLNPAGSIKDRTALEMVDDAEKNKGLKPGDTMIEPTSGNTGIGLALIAAVRGYRLILTMPETMSVERRKLLAAYGAEIVLTPGERGMQGAVEKAEELNREIPGSLLMGQFDNPANAQAHYKTTGPEIFRDLDGKADVLVRSGWCSAE